MLIVVDPELLVRTDHSPAARAPTARYADPDANRFDQAPLPINWRPSDVAPTFLARASALIDVTVNGEPRHLDPGSTVAALLGQMALSGKRVAVERNGEIVPKGRHADTVLAPGDTLEIVAAVGGG
jgi:sulfur carrier protein